MVEKRGTKWIALAPPDNYFTKMKRENPKCWVDTLAYYYVIFHHIDQAEAETVIGFLNAYCFWKPKRHAIGYRYIMAKTGVSHRFAREVFTHKVIRKHFRFTVIQGKDTELAPKSWEEIQAAFGKRREIAPESNGVDSTDESMSISNNGVAHHPGEESMSACATASMQAHSIIDMEFPDDDREWTDEYDDSDDGMICVEFPDDDREWTDEMMAEKLERLASA